MKIQAAKKLKNIFIGMVGLIWLLGCDTTKTVSEVSDSTLTGTAATGAPIDHALVTVIDQAGEIVATETDEMGKFAVSVADLKMAPYLLKVDLPDESSLFSIAMGPGVANIHPLSDTIVRLAYQEQGGAIETAFDDPKRVPAPASARIDSVKSDLSVALTASLQKAGVDVTRFDLLTTVFQADGEGFDGLLDALVISPGGTLSIEETETGEVSEITTEDVTEDVDVFEKPSPFNKAVTISKKTKPAPIFSKNSIKKANPASGTTVLAGQTIAYTIDYMNTGKVAATEVTITDILDKRLTDLTVTLGTGTILGNKIVWSVGSVPVGGSGSVGFSTKVISGTSMAAITNKAIIASKENWIGTKTKQTIHKIPVTYGLNVKKLGKGSGIVTSNPAGIDCGTDCSEPFGKGAMVSLTATPNSGSTFASWSGVCSEKATTTAVKITRAGTCTATFNLSPLPPPPPPPPPSSANKPKGIYVLDSQGGELINGVSLRDRNIRDYPFVAGYAWRQVWATFEPSEGVYDFALIDGIIAKLNPINKSLTILIGNAASAEPAYIIAHPGVATWTMQKSTGPVTRAVPWDPYLTGRLRAFAMAMGNHLVPDPSGKMVPFRDHPLLVNVDFGLAGLGRIRDEAAGGAKNYIKDIPGYTRENLTKAVLDHLDAATDAFPNKFVEIGLWNVEDKTLSPHLWEHLTGQILAEFDGVKHPKVGFFQENLAASKDLATGVITGTPSVAFAAPLLYPAKNSTFTVLQALETWGASAKSANTTPNDGIQYGYDTFGTEYFEIYVTDIDKLAYQADFQKWHNFFFP
ncbi:MAG: beta-galactosidase [Nitrospirota bacterium]